MTMPSTVHDQELEIVVATFRRTDTATPTLSGSR